MRVFAVIVLVSLNQVPCFCQPEQVKHHFYSLQGQYGFIIPHSVVIEPVSHTNPYGILADIATLKTSLNSWSVFNTYWLHGLQAGYYDFQNPDILGGAFVLTAFAEPFLIHGKSHIISVRLGAGFSYHTKIYDAAYNQLNQFFCTRISFPVYASLRFKYRLTGSTFLTFSGYYNHISNGGLKQPNYGMNFPVLSAGIEYYRSGFPVLEKRHAVNMVEKPALVIFGELLTAYRVVDKTEYLPEKSAMAIGASISIAWRIRTWYSLNAGAEFISDGAIKETIRRENLDLDHNRFALTAGQDFWLGKVIFTQYFGIYVYCPYEAHNSVYEKYELNYRLSRNIMAGVYLKAHTHDAELMGFNLTVMLRPSVRNP
jgi:hypothetical protein